MTDICDKGTYSSDVQPPAEIDQEGALPAKEDTADPAHNSIFRPIKILGEPLSATIIRERRR